VAACLSLDLANLRHLASRRCERLRRPAPKRIEYDACITRPAPRSCSLLFTAALASVLTGNQRMSVEATVAETAIASGWTLVSVSARTNHVQVLISAQREPERVMSPLKSGCTRRMRETGLINPSVRPWTEHGSTRYLWKQADVDRAALYVLEAQDGERFDTDED
jgi:hypothetical protein